jgi:uncharacterized cupredoxin-like copper-binding protein/Cu/Ag efflux protein CusF
MKTRQLLTVLAAASVAWLHTPLCFAHGGSGHAGHASAAALKEQQDWGIGADAKDAQRTIRIRMGDDMRFKPDHIEVQEGEIVKLVLTNQGKQLHELVIGTPQELQAHAQMMRMHPNMEHNEAHMAHVLAGKTGQLVWHFNRAGQFAFACLIPGHFEAGMVGTITVKPKAGAIQAAAPSASAARAAPSTESQGSAALDPWARGQVRRIDLNAKKITLKHGFIATLGMDPMTMVFQMRDAEVLQTAQSLKPGDAVEFVAAYDKGVYLVTQIKPAAAKPAQ